MYLSRVFNPLVSVLLIWFAIRLIPFARLGMLLLACMPMTLTQLASNSYDATLIGIAFLLLAYVLHLKFKWSPQVRKAELLKLAVLFMILACCKPVYNVMVFLYLLLAVSKIGSLKKYIILFFSFIALMVALPYSFTAFRAVFAGNIPHIPVPWLDPVPQLHFILGNVAGYGKILFNTCFIVKRNFYFQSFIGVLGWLDNPLPSSLIKSFLCILLVNALLAGNRKFRLSLRDKMILLGTFIAGLLAVETAIYLTWTPVGGSIVEGVQGRYFIPLAPMLLLVFSNNEVSALAGRFWWFLQTGSRKPGITGYRKKRAVAGCRIHAKQLAGVFISLFIFTVLCLTVFVVYYRYN